MPATNAETVSMTTASEKASFFRQSGWLMIANVGGGVFMWAVHFLNKPIPPGAYGEFGVCLAVVMLVPTFPLQMVLAQQTAKALALQRPGELSALFRRLLIGTTLLWLVASIGVFLFQGIIVQRWQLSSPTPLWITMGSVLASLWLPMVWGILQGQQNFLWLGWSMISNGVGRLLAACVAVLALHLYTSGLIGGVLLGLIVAFMLGAWHCRSLWLTKPVPIDWRALLNQIIPVFIGFLGFQLLFTTDTLFVKASFSKTDSDCYVAAGTLSRALMWLVLPLASVMFPKIVQAAARTEKTDMVKWVLWGTFGLAFAGVLGLWILGPFVVRLVYKPEYVALTTKILPLYAFAMVPLAVANVRLNDTLARPNSQWVFSSCVLAVAIGYVFALSRFHASPTQVLQIMLGFNTLLLAVCLLTPKPKSA
jgi:O-antigen/teichoic acid export membrane protein